MKKKTNYIFWIRSSRGTNFQHIIPLDANITKDGIRSELEYWCEGFGAWTFSESTVEYGYTPANKTNINKLKNYKIIKEQRRDMLDKFIINAITRKDYHQWLKKNEKKLKFPFKSLDD